MPLADLSPEGDKIHLETLYREKNLVREIPGATWNHKKGIWTAPISWGTCVIMRGVFGDQLEIGPELQAWALNELETRITPANNLREAVDFSGSKQLFGYQRAGVEFLSIAERAMLCDGLGAGKAQPLSEPVLTPEGFKPMGDIKQGDYVIGADGQPTLVYGTYRQGVRPVYKVTFSDGTFTFVDRDHLWRVQSLKGIKYDHWQVLSTAELINRGISMEVAARGSRHHKWRIQFVEPIDFGVQEQELPLDPYVLGVLLGDGCLTRPSRVSFCSVDGEIVDRVERSLPYGVLATREQRDRRSPDLIGVTLSSGQSSSKSVILDVLRELGVHGCRAETKFVPQDYMQASIDDRLALLRGLMDTDGCAGRNNHASFASSSKKLRDDVAWLVRSLGGRAELKEKAVPKGGNFPVYGVVVRMPAGMNPFHLSRKADLIKPPTKYPPSKFIAAIEYSHDEETQCIAVAANDHLYVTRDFIVTHNTRQAIMTAMRLYEKGHNPFPMLVVAPNSTKTGWKREADTVWPGLEVHVIKGSAAQRRKMLESPGHMYIMNWEQIRGHSRLAPYGSIALKRCKECGGEDERVTFKNCEVHKRELNQIDFNMVVADEAHRMKDPSTKQTRALWAATGDARFRLAMTGTPIADAPDDLWTILHWLDPNEWPSRSRFIDRYAQLQYNAFGAPIVTGLRPETKEEFFRIVNPRMRRMPKDLVLKHLPPVIYERREVELSPKQMKAYNDMRDKLVVDLDGDVLTAASPLTKMTRLLQFSSSYAEIVLEQRRKPHSDEMEEVEVVKLIEPSCKIDAFMNDIDDFGSDSVVVFAVSRQLIYLLHERMEKAKIPHGLLTGAQSTDERQQSIDDFQSGKTKFILCTIAAGGVGLTLTAGRIAVYLQRSWSNIENVQSEGRVHRIGSEIHESILYIDYVSANTVEETQHEAVKAKGERLEEILRDKDLLRRALLNEAVIQSLETQVHDKDHNDGTTEGL